VAFERIDVFDVGLLIRLDHDLLMKKRKKGVDCTRNFRLTSRRGMPGD
jgi:hypothetical protein